MQKADVCTLLFFIFAAVPMIKWNEKGESGSSDDGEGEEASKKAIFRSAAGTKRTLVKTTDVNTDVSASLSMVFEHLAANEWFKQWKMSRRAKHSRANEWFFCVQNTEENIALLSVLQQHQAKWQGSGLKGLMQDVTMPGCSKLDLWNTRQHLWCWWRQRLANVHSAGPFIALFLLVLAINSPAFKLAIGGNLFCEHQIEQSGHLHGQSTQSVTSQDLLNVFFVFFWFGIKRGRGMHFCTANLARKGLQASSRRTLVLSFWFCARIRL